MPIRSPQKKTTALLIWSPKSAYEKRCGCSRPISGFGGQCIGEVESLITNKVTHVHAAGVSREEEIVWGEDNLDVGKRRKHKLNVCKRRSVRAMTWLLVQKGSVIDSKIEALLRYLRHVVHSAAVPC